MAARIIVVDYAGTLVKASMIEQGGLLRDGVFDREMAAPHEHGHAEKLYAKNRDAIAELTGLTEDMIVAHREADGGDVDLSGKQFMNELSTSLFGLGMLNVAHKYGDEFFAEGMVEQLTHLKSQGYELAIVSGVRRDIISATLTLGGATGLFDYIQGQPGTLGISNIKQLEDLQTYGTITHVIGDKLSDLESAGAVGAQAVFVTWGHPSGGEEALANHTVDSAEELRDIFE